MSMIAVSRGVTVVDGPEVARGDVAQAAVRAAVMMVTMASRFMARSGQGIDSAWSTATGQASGQRAGVPAVLRRSCPSLPRPLGGDRLVSPFSVAE